MTIFLILNILNFIIISYSKIIETDYSQKYRPQYHYSPPTLWMNDPNGLFIDKTNTYHLMYQYNSQERAPGQISWGQATSKDLLNWTVQNVAIPYNHVEKIAAFSGSAVIDYKNSTGLQPEKSENPPYIAIYTGNYDNEGDKENQRLAYSTDPEGLIWQDYENNPILNLDTTNFRDPKIFQYNNLWYMIVAKPDQFKVMFFKSKNLIDWDFTGEFQQEQIAVQWECPDLIKILDQNNQEKWIFILNINPGGINQGNSALYFLGQFNGETFIADDFQKDDTFYKLNTIDFGKDHYAVTSYFNKNYKNNYVQESPQLTPILFAWMSDWEYAQQEPTQPWCGQMTFPRQYKIDIIEGVQRLRQYFANEPLKKILENSSLTYSFDRFKHFNPQQQTLDFNNTQFKKQFTQMFKNKNEQNQFLNQQNQLQYLDQYQKQLFTFVQKDLKKQSSQPKTQQQFYNITYMVPISNFNLEFGVYIVMNDDEKQYTKLTFHSNENNFQFDRRKSGDISFSPDFASEVQNGYLPCSIPKNCIPDNIRDGYFLYNVQILQDSNSLEVSVMDGLSFMTQLIFPDENSFNIEVFGVPIESIEIRQIQPITPFNFNDLKS